MNVHAHRIGPRFLETMGIPLLLGRTFSPQEMESAPKAALVNQAFARRYFSDANPLGKHFRWSDDRDIEIVGMVGNAKYADLRQPAPPTAYFPYRLDEEPTSSVYFEVKAAGNPKGLISPVRQVIRKRDHEYKVVKIAAAGDKDDDKK